MNEYHKIQTIFKRDPENKHKTLLEGQFTLQEFEFLKDNLWVFTEKVDGTNIRIMCKSDGVTFGGKTEQAQIPATLITRLQEHFVGGHHFEHDVCLYGEGYGPKIQKGGGNYRQDQDFVLFDVKVGDMWLRRDSVEEIAEKLNIDVVPIIGVGTVKDMISKCRKGFRSVWGDFQAEGIVARPVVELQTRDGHRIITKLKCKDFEVKA